MTEQTISAQPTDYYFLQGGGEMGELTRQYNWAATAIGGPGQWPQSLRTVVGLILNSRFPMFLFWGPEHTCFYNDAYRPSLGNNGKHPYALGKPGAAVWPEIWAVIKPLIDHVLAGGGATWSENQLIPIYRNGRLEDVYWTFSYSPVHDELGQPAGVFVTCMDTTQTVQNIRKLEEGSQRLDNIFKQVGAGIAQTDLTGRFMEVNERYCQMLGYSCEELLKLSIGEVTHPEDMPLNRQLLQECIETGQDFLINKRYIRKDGSLLWVSNSISLVIDLQGNKSLTAISIDNTAEKLHELQLAESEAKFRSLIEEAPVATCLFVGRNLVVEVANDIMLRYWGKERSIIGKPLRVALPELEGQPFLQILDNVFTTGETYKATGEMAQMVVNGIKETFYFDYTYKPLFNITGEVYAIMDMATDVTEEVVARKKLEESELFARSIIDNSPVAKAVFVGENMVIRTVNQNMLLMLGRDESIIGKPFTEAMPELISTPLIDRLQHVYATGETYTQPEEKIELIKHGKPYTGYYNYIYKALHNTVGHIYGVITTATEVTDQVLARQQVEDAELKLLAAIELAKLGTWNIDLVSKRITYSPRLQSWLGVSEGVLNLDNSPRVHKKDRERVILALQQALTQGSNGIFDEVYTIINQQSGKELIIHANGKTFYDEQGKPVSISGTAQDITMQQELQLALENEVQKRTEELAAANRQLAEANEELYSSNDQLIRSNEELAQYAYVASHDLQEPLRKIRMFSSQLTMKESLSDNGVELITKISTATERMTILIRDLLEFSRLLNSDVLMQPVDLNAVAQDVVNDFDLLVKETGGHFSVGRLPVIEGVLLQLTQLFYNLVGNALKFRSADRKPVITITASLLDEGELEQYITKPLESVPYYRLSIADNGIGFEAQYADQIFEVFKRLHNREVYPGSGIGLALCRRIVANHKGHLYAVSQPHQGSTFCIVLPAKQPG